MRDYSGTGQWLTAATLSLSGACAVSCRVVFDTLSVPASTVRGIVVKGQWGADANGDLRLVLKSGGGPDRIAAQIDTSSGSFEAASATTNFSTGVEYGLVGEY